MPDVNTEVQSVEVAFAGEDKPFATFTMRQPKTVKGMIERYGLSESDVCDWANSALEISARIPIKHAEKAKRDGGASYNAQALHDAWKPGQRAARVGVGKLDKARSLFTSLLLAGDAEATALFPQLRKTPATADTEMLAFAEKRATVKK